MGLPVIPAVVSFYRGLSVLDKAALASVPAGATIFTAQRVLNASKNINSYFSDVVDIQSSNNIESVQTMVNDFNSKVASASNGVKNIQELESSKESLTSGSGLINTISRNGELISNSITELNKSLVLTNSLLSSIASNQLVSISDNKIYNAVDNKVSLMRMSNEVLNISAEEDRYVAKNVMFSMLLDKLEEISSSIRGETVEKVVKTESHNGVQSDKKIFTVGKKTDVITSDTQALRESLNSISSVLNGIAEKNNEVLELEKAKLQTELKKVKIDGKEYTNAEVEALRNVEELKGLKDENDFELNDALDLVDDLISDGFELDFNPLNVILNELKATYEKEYNDIKTKYNIKV